MKKIGLLLSILTVFLLFPSQVLAVDYSIEQSRIDAYLQDNGSVQVRESHTYSFDGEFNGITRSLIPKEETAIRNVVAREGDAILEVEQEVNNYRIYRSGSDEKITINISYMIENGIEKYTDVARFDWPFFDKSNESDYAQMDVYVYPPEPTEGVIAYGEDEAAGTEKVEEEGVVHFAMGFVDSGHNGDIRTTFDASLFPNTPLTADKAMREEILVGKEEQEQKQAAYEKRQNFFTNISPYVIGALTVYLLLLIMYVVQKRNTIQREADRRFGNSYFVPKEEMSLPATIAYMNGRLINEKTMTAALLDLVRKGFVKHDGKEQFTVIKRETDHKHESILISWLFDKIGRNGEFTLQHLKKYTKDKKNHKAYQGDFQKWKQAVISEVKSNKLTSTEGKLRIAVGLSTLLMLPLIILFGIYELFLSMALTIVFFGTFLSFAGLYSPRTVKGARIHKQWQSFQEKYPYLKEQEWGELQDDDQKRAFIYSLGTHSKKANKMSEQMMKNTPTYNSGQTDFVMFMVIAAAINHNFKEAHTTAAAAYSSSGGGTPGGGAGVGGGGGGSGAF
ncbi:DUF2207 domain-containing protein [Oceanobacillus manasiensis]|uniref:DUF2207 domain-containing protein n=1 Tax=Oceanobacillus manasiensis TaxID=586413 RepID=UPI0005A5EFB9|nr:DUF2207 domain-containing protein [Oceanobacillus manasiensis]